MESLEHQDIQVHQEPLALLDIKVLPEHLVVLPLLRLFQVHPDRQAQLDLQDP